MIVRNIKDIIGTEKEVSSETWTSRRLLLKDDQMGFSFHETIIYAGTETHIHYKNHLEAVYCVGGDGEIETISDGKVYPIKDGDRKSTRLNSSHVAISYAVFCLKKKKKKRMHNTIAAKNEQ